MYRKISILALLLITITLGVQADGGEFASGSLEDTPYSIDFDTDDAYDRVFYGGAATMTLSCDSSEGDCSGVDRHEVYVCGKKTVVNLDGDNQDSQLLSVGTSNKEGTEVPCGTELNIDVYQGYRSGGGRIGSTNHPMMPPVNPDEHGLHKADNILLSIDITGDQPQLRAFQLTDGIWDHGGQVQESGNIMVKYHDPGSIPFTDNHDREVYAADIGSVMEKGEPVGYLADTDCDPDSSNACKALNENSLTENEKDYTYDNPSYNLHIFQNQLTNLIPLHDNEGYYSPQGEIIAGYEPEHYTGGSEYSKSEEGPKFFICRSESNYVRGSTMQGENGITPQVVDISDPSTEANDLYKCDRPSGEWQQVNVCGDGLDNDGDEAVDLNDVCSSTSGTSEQASTCNPRIGRLAEDYTNPSDGGEYSEDTKVAFYDDSGKQFQDLESGCAYNNFDPYVDYADQPPELFRCTESGDSEGYSPDDESEDKGEAVSDDSEINSYCSDISNSILPGTWSVHDGKMPVVEYFVAKEDMHLGTNRFATKNGFQNKFFQTLHDAEEDNAVEVDICEDNPDGTVPPSCTSGPHNNESYEPLNMTDLHDGYNAGEYMESWTFANGSANNNEITSKGEDLSDDRAFSGGFAGKCPAGQKWRYVGQEDAWRCTGAIGWSFNYTVPDLKEKSSDSTVGVFLDGRIFESGTDQSLTSTWFRQKGSEISLNTVKAKCYAGATGFSEVSSDKRFPDGPDAEQNGWREKDISTGIGDKSLVGVTGNINMSAHNEYTCEWEFTAIKDDTGEQIPFRQAGTPKEIERQHLDSFDPIDNFDPSNLCADSCGERGITVSQGQMEDLSAAANLTG